MFNRIMMLLVFIGLALYGLFHSLSYVNSMRADGFVSGRGTIVAVSPSERRGEHTGSYDHYQTVVYEYGGRQFTVSLHASGVSRPDMVGRDTPLLINTQNPERSLMTSFLVQTVSGLIMTAIGLAGSLLASLSLRRYRRKQRA
jgi:hypothetical protein